MGFRLEPIRSASKKTIEFTGNKVLINRTDIDTEDSYVSRKAHAQFEYRDGQWYISNLSPNKALFIQVEGEIPIPENCMILFGVDNFFSFHPNPVEPAAPDAPPLESVSNCKQCWHPLPETESICPSCGYNNDFG